MASLLRAAAAGGGPRRRASFFLSWKLIRSLCSSSFPCFDHSPLVPHQPHLYHIPPSIGLRYLSRSSSSSTTDEDHPCDSVRGRHEIKTQEIPEAEEPPSRFALGLDGSADVCLDAMTEDESVDSIAAEEIVDDEPVDSDDLSARGGTASDPDSEVWWAEETEDDEEGNAYPVPKGDDTHTSSSKDFETWIHATDISTLPDGMEGMVQVDDAFESESAEHDCAVQGGDMHLLTLEEVKEVLQNVRARDIQFFPVHDRCDWTDLMVLATGISDRHVHGIADALVYKIKKKPYIDSTLYPTIEGKEGGKWLVVDCGNIVIHVLTEEGRAYYKLEQLWSGDMRFGTADQDLEKMLKTVGLKELSR